MQQFNPSDMLRVRHSLVALVEELKLRKKCETDNEAKIQELINKIHVLQRSLDLVQDRARLKEEESERAMRELRQEYEDKLRRLDIEQQQRSVRAESRLHVEDRMKEEMMQLQMTIFHQEKTIKELETKLQTQETFSEKTLSQWATVEKQLLTLTEIYQMTQDSEARLQRDVKAAVVLNKKLSRLNRHQNCQLMDKCAEVSRLKEEVLKLRVQASSPATGDIEIQALRSTIDKLNSKIANLEDQALKKNEELLEQADHAMQAVSSLQTAHMLINKHQNSANKYLVETDKLSKECTLLSFQCNALKHQLSSAEKDLEGLTLSMKKSSEDWEQKNNKLEEVLMAKDQLLHSLEESKAHQEQTLTGLCERNQELVQQLEKAQSKLDVPRADFGVLVGNSIFTVTNRSLQTDQDLATVATQTVACPSKSMITQTVACPSKSMITQTTRPQTTDDVCQTDDKRSQSSLTQTDALVASSMATQTLPSIMLSINLNQDLPPHTPSEIRHGLLIHQDKCSTDNSSNRGCADLAVVKIETTECSNGQLSTFDSKDKHNVTALDSANKVTIKVDRERISNDPTGNNACFNKSSNNLTNIVDGASISAERDLLARSEGILPLSSVIAGETSTTDHSTIISIKTHLSEFMEQVLADYSQQEDASSTHLATDKPSGNIKPSIKLRDNRNPFERFSKISIPQQQSSPADFFATSQDQFGPLFQESSNTPINIVEPNNCATLQKSVCATGVKVTDASYLSHGPAPGRPAEHVVKISTTLNVMSVAELTSDHSLGSVLTCSDGCSAINGNNRQATITGDTGLDNIDYGVEMKVCSRIHSSEIAGYYTGRLESLDASLVCESNDRNDNSSGTMYVDRVSQVSDVSKTKEQSTKKTRFCEEKSEGSETAEASTSKVNYSKASLHSPQTYLSDISKPPISPPSVGIELNQLDERFSTDNKVYGQSLPDMQPQQCAEPDSNQAVENVTLPSQGLPNISFCLKKVPISLKLAKPGRATRSSSLFALPTGFTPNLCLKRLSSDTITRTDLASPPNPSPLLSMQSSALGNPEKENPSRIYPSFSYRRDISLNQSQAMKSGSSISCGPSILQPSPQNQNLWEPSITRPDTSQRSAVSTEPSNPAACSRDLKKPRMSHTFLDNKHSSLGKEHRKLSQLRSPGDRQRERSTKLRSRDKSRYHMLFLSPKEREDTQSLAGCENDNPLARGVRPKGILKAPQANRRKSMTSKSVSFPQELEHHQQDNQQTQTRADTSAGKPVTVNVKCVDFSHMSVAEIMDYRVESKNSTKALQPDPCSSPPAKDGHSSSLGNKETAFSSPLFGSYLTGPCLTVPETPNLELSDMDCEGTSRPASAETSPVTAHAYQRSKHACQEDAVDGQVPAVETGDSAAKKQRGC